MVVFKRIFLLNVLILLFIPLAVQSQEIKINGFVNDYANIISPEYESQIQGVLQAIYNSKTAEFSIVTVDSLDGRDIQSYALNLAQGKLGDTEKNNGLLLLVSLKDRKYRFEVGRGIEPILNDAKIGRVGRTYLVENFRTEEYGKGIYEASLAVKTTLMGETDSVYYVDEVKIQPRSNQLFTFLTVLIFWIVMFTLIASARKRRHGKGKDNRFFDAALMAAILFGGGRRGGGFGGMGGGGFGGFGGGGFGGGGAGGGW